MSEQSVHENQTNFSYPSPDAFAVTPHASNNIVDSNSVVRTARALFIGVGGNVTLVTKAGNVVLFKNLPSGSILPVSCIRVNAVGTAATDIVALF